MTLSTYRVILKIEQKSEAKDMDTTAKEKIRLTLDGKKKSWYKFVTGVNRSKGNNGYALEGDFIKQGKQQEFSPWDVFVKMEPRGVKPEYHVTYAQWLYENDYWSRAYDRRDFLDFLDLVDSYLEFANEEKSSEKDTEEGKSIQECWMDAQSRVLDANALAETIRNQGGDVSNEQVLEALHKLGY